MFQKALKRVLRQVDLEIVKWSDHAKGVEVRPRRWIVERAIGWLNRCRRLAKDWENLNRKALVFLRLASARRRIDRICGSLYLLVFIKISSCKVPRKFYLRTP